MTITSYAQAKEDVLLFRALKTVPHQEGFYIDVGANDPDVDSVTRLFYEHGWHGINLEPSVEWMARLRDRRPRDINIQAAVSSHAGEFTFHDNPGGQLGTLVEEFATRHEQQGIPKRSYTVQGVTLAQICEEHVGDRPIHFLKIDVEGHEGAVIEGMDFRKFRPWILVIEATEPNRLDVPTYAEWDKLVQKSGYLFAYTDVLNRYYVAHEHAKLAACFSVPADDYILAHKENHIRHLEAKVRELEQRK